MFINCTVDSFIHSFIHSFKVMPQSKNERDSVTRFFTLFIHKFYLGPNWTDKNGFAKLFVFSKIFDKNVCLRSHGLRGHDVGKLWRLLTDFKGTIRRIKEKIAMEYLSENKKVCETVLPAYAADYADTRFSNFAIDSRKLNSFFLFICHMVPR